MIVYALLALGIGASAGIFLASRHFLRKRLPASVALLHGLGGATGFVFVLLTVVRQPSFWLARQALYLLIATVALGCVNLLFHVRKVRHRTSLIVMHALCAVSAVSTLVYANFFVPPTQSAPKARPVPQIVPDLPSKMLSKVVGDHEKVVGAPEPERPTPPPTPAAPSAARSAEASAASVTGPLTTPPIRFDAASFNLPTDSSAALDQAAEYLRLHSEIKLVEVQGHADERGQDARNVELTRARAQSVVEALVAKGVARPRLRAAGYGARCPEAPECRSSSAPPSCHDSVRQAADRRVALLVLVDGSATFHGEVACSRGEALIPPADRAFQARAP